MSRESNVLERKSCIQVKPEMLCAHERFFVFFSLRNRTALRHRRKLEQSWTVPVHQRVFEDDASWETWHRRGLQEGLWLWGKTFERANGENLSLYVSLSSPLDQHMSHQPMWFLANRLRLVIFQWLSDGFRHLRACEKLTKLIASDKVPVATKPIVPAVLEWPLKPLGQARRAPRAWCSCTWCL